MKALKAAGDATELAVAQSEASKLSVDASIASLRQQIDQMENTLTALLGIAPQKIDRTTIGEQRFPTELAAGVPLQLLQRRPDVRQSEAALAQAFYATNAARAAFYPSITLSGSAGWTNAAGAAITNPGQWLFTAVGSLVQPLFNPPEPARCRHRREQCPYTVADGTPAPTDRPAADTLVGVDRTQFGAADAILVAKLPRGAHGTPDSPASGADGRIGPFRRDTGCHQPLPRLGRRSGVTFS